MKPWLARAFALAFTVAAIYLVILRVHAASALLETALGAAVLCVLGVALLWRLPILAAVMNAGVTLAAFAAVFFLAGRPAGVAQSAARAVVTEPPDAQQAIERLKPEDYAVAALAPKLPTPEAAFAWVRDNVRYEAYQGILRGAQGTLRTRAGNAADRAMLLAAILQTNKIPVRMATGQLPAAEAERLYLRIFEPDRGATAMPPAERGPLSARIFDRGRRDYNVILAALGNGIPQVTSPSHDEVVKEIEQHAWVQMQRNGQWIDLDPSFPDSKVGQTYASVQQTYDNAPFALMQRVTIRVVVERLVNGALVKDVALEQTVPAFEIIDRQIYLAHEVYKPFKGAGGQLQFIFGNKDTQVPVLYVADSRIEGKPIDFGSGASAAGTAPPNAVQQAANAFGTPKPSPQAAANAFVAEWLEFENAFPDGSKDLNRRVLIDRAGTAWRHASNHDASALHDLTRASDGTLIAPKTVYNIWLSAGKHDLLAFTAAAERLASEGPSGPAPTFQAAMWPLGIRDLSWFMASDHIIVPALNDSPDLRFYADSPRIFVWSFGPDPNGQPNAMLLESDLRRDVLRGVAKDPSAQTLLAQHKVWFGALEGALERELSAPADPAPGSTSVSTSSLADSGNVVVFGPGTAPSASDPETQARMSAALAGGDTLVVPKRVLGGGEAGWWQIANQTGDMRAVLDDDLDGTKDGWKTPGGYDRKPPDVPKMPRKPVSDPSKSFYSDYDKFNKEFESWDKALAECEAASNEMGEECNNLQISRAGSQGVSRVTLGIIAAGAGVLGILYEILK
jgi:hypothetical protein